MIGMALVTLLALSSAGCGPATPPPTVPPALTTLTPTETPRASATPQASSTTTLEATAAPQRLTATVHAPTATAQATPVPTPLAALPPPVEPLTQALAGPLGADSAASVTEIARWGGGAVSDVVYSPGGKQVALVTTLGLEVRDAETMAELPFLRPERGWSLGAFSLDWQTVAWKSGRLIRLQRVSDGQVLRMLEGEPGRVGRVAFSPDGSLLACMRFPPGEEVYTGNVELWRVSDGVLLTSWDAEGSDLIWSPGGKLLATWMAMTGVSVWSVPDGARLHFFEGGALDAAFSPDGQSLAFAGFAGGGVQLWRISDLTRLWQMEALPSRIRFSPDGSLLAFPQLDGTAQIARVSDGQSVRVVGYGLADSASPLTFSPDGQVLALGSSMDVQFWRVADGTLLQVLEGHSYGIESTVVSSDGSTVAFMTRSPSAPGATLHLRDIASASASPLENSGDALSFAWSPDGKTAALGTWDFCVRLVQVPGGQVNQTLDPLSAQVQSVAFAPHGDLLAASSMGEVGLWRAGDGTRLHTFRPPGAGWLESATFSPDGSLLAAHAALPVGTVWVWDAETYEVILTLADTESEYRDNLAFLPDGTALAVEKPGEVELWSMPEGNLLRRFKVAADAGPFAFSPDGTLLALSSGDVVQLWSVSDGELLATLVGHTGWVGSVTFSPDGQYLVTGSEDGTVRLWGVPALHTPEPAVLPSPELPRQPEVLSEGTLDCVPAGAFSHCVDQRVCFRSAVLFGAVGSRVENDLYSLLGVRLNSKARKCDETSQEAFDAQLMTLIESITSRTADAETLDSVDELIHLAESIVVQTWPSSGASWIQHHGLSPEIHNLNHCHLRASDSSPGREVPEKAAPKKGVRRCA